MTIEMTGGTAHPPFGSDGKVSARIVVAIISGATSIVVALITANYTAENKIAGEREVIYRNQQETTSQLNRLAGSTPGPLTDGQKLCRVLGKNQPLGDGVIVPQDWTVNTCKDYQLRVGGSTFELGCVFPNGTSIGKPDGGLPDRPCGWQ
jgi:hypothetical protein